MTTAARASARGATLLSTLLFVVHATNDSFSAMLSALLPTLQLRFSLTETALAALVATLSLSSSVTQPLFGRLVDRYGRRLLASVGVATSSLLLSLIAVAPSPWLLAALLAVGGLGSAAFHPAGTAIARSLAAGRKGLAVSVFSAGGTVGIAVGPLVIGVLLITGRLDATPWLMLPGLLGAIAIYALVPAAPRIATSQRPKQPSLIALLRGPLGALAASGILRSMAFVAFANGMPLYLTGTIGLPIDAPVVFATLTLFSASAAVGGIVIGSLERRVPRATLIAGTLLLAAVPLALLFVSTPGTLPYFVAVAAAGAFINGGLPLSVVVAQDLAPQAMGAASGLMMGFTWGVAGVLYVGVGALQEAWGVAPAMALSFACLLPSAALAFGVLRRHAARIAAAD
jgi:MFS transporter, FSR family, fosmidomycin resistance protein